MPGRIIAGLTAAAVLVLGRGCDGLFLVPTTYGCGGDPIECSGAEFTPRSACADGCSQAYTCLVNDCRSADLVGACPASAGCSKASWDATLCLAEPTSLVQCRSIKDESPCLARSDCRWGLHCTGLLQPCKGIKDQATCQSTPTCFWHRNSG